MKFQRILILGERALLFHLASSPPKGLFRPENLTPASGHRFERDGRPHIRWAKAHPPTGGHQGRLGPSDRRDRRWCPWKWKVPLLLPGEKGRALGGEEPFEENRTKDADGPLPISAGGRDPQRASLPLRPDR